MEKDIVWNLIAKKLTGEATLAEREELELLLRQNPELHYSLQTITDFWESNPSLQRLFADRAYDHHLDRMRQFGIGFSQLPAAISEEEYRPSPVRKKYFRSLALAASLLLVLTAGIGLFSRHSETAISKPASPEKERDSGEVMTRYGSKTNLLLPDGSSVWLNAGSELHYDSSFGKTVREVTLSGEGFFDVVKDARRPFIIHTGRINIRVLGTAFNVKSYPGEKTIETSLIRGSIEVTFRDRLTERMILKPNQKLVVSAVDKTPDPGAAAGAMKVFPTVAIRALSHFGADSLVTETAWVQNKLVFQDQSFRELARMMERWYAIRIDFRGTSLDTLHFTGNFEKETIEQALTALQVSSKFIYTIHNNEVELSNSNQ
jgi:transmembrane sensor